MATYFTSDLHLGHMNIIRYCGRPFADVPSMDDALVAAWNATVSDDDTVWVLGDVAMGRIEDSLSRVAELAGTKLLVPGNHDRCWAGSAKDPVPWRQRYLDAGFSQVVDAPGPVELAGRSVRMAHFPYAGDSGDEDRFVEHRLADDGGWLLHGHVHESFRQRGRCINVGLDAWGGRPVHSDVLAELVAAGPGDLDVLAWC